jgi:hypothetical protein
LLRGLSLRPQCYHLFSGKAHSPFWVFAHQSGITKKLPIQTGLGHLFNGLNNAATQRCLALWIMPLDSCDDLYIFCEKPIKKTKAQS